MPYSDLSICNLALGEVPHKSIQSLGERSLAAAKCVEHYPQARDEMLEAHRWRFLTARVVLAPVANDRPSEWSHAYALPDDMGYPQRIVVPEDADPGSAFATVGQRIAASWPLQGDPTLNPYHIAGGVLYTNVAGAILEHSRKAVSEALFPASFVRALSLDLASRLVMPLIKNRARQGELLRAGELQRQRAIAADENMAPSMEPAYVSEAARARGAW